MLRTLFLLNTYCIPLKKVTSGVHWVFWEFAFWSVCKALFLKITHNLSKENETGGEVDDETALKWEAS